MQINLIVRLSLALSIANVSPTLAASAIYKCEQHGTMTFSDRPCGSDAQLHRLDSTVMNTYAAPPSTSSHKRSPAKVVRRTPARKDESEEKRQESCAKAARSLKEVGSKMRSGYSAKEGERLRERQAKLRDQQRQARCR
jgi:hypothetical protein